MISTHVVVDGKEYVVDAPLSVLNQPCPGCVRVFQTKADVQHEPNCALAALARKIGREVTDR